MSISFLSVIVPVYREAAIINECLAHIDEWSSPVPLEVIVVDGDDDTTVRHIDSHERGYPLRVVRSERGRGNQLHAGAAHARGDALLFLHVDTRLSRRAPEKVVDTLSSADAGAFTLTVDSSSAVIRSIAAVAAVRSRLTRIPYGDQAHFVTRDAYLRAGGYRPIPIMEDVAFMRCLKRGNFRVSLLRERARNTDRRWRKEGPLRSTLRNWLLMLLYRAGASPFLLVRLYTPHNTQP